MSSSAILQHCRNAMTARSSQRFSHSTIRSLSRAYWESSNRSIVRTFDDLLLRKTARRSLAIVANPPMQQEGWNYQQRTKWGWSVATMATGLAGVAAISSSRHPATCCEEAASKEKEDAETSAAENEEKNKYEIGPDDPYYEVPEDDEPTDCQMCLTFRQGPCRTEWKRFEMCAKDKNPALNADSKNVGEGGKSEQTKEDNKKEEESGALACMKYAMPFYECSSKYVNTYIILGNELTFQKVIRPLHDAFSSEEAQSRRLCWVKNPEMNWKGWEYFVSKLEELGGGIPSKFRLENTGFNSPAEALKASWEGGDGQQYLMMDNENEPYVINVSAQVPKKEGDHTLMMTYALDQYGNLLGDKRYDEEGEAEEKAEKKDDEERKAQSPNVDLSIQLLPGVTESITIYGLYVPNNDSDFLTEGKLYESKPCSVPQSSSKETPKKAKMQTKKKKKKTSKKKLEE